MTNDAQVALGDGWTAGLSPTPGGALLRVAGDAQVAGLEIVISLTATGPVLRARAAAVEVIAERDIVARCESFRVEARRDLVLTAGGTLQGQGRRVEVEATHGSARVRANDDVQLLGENVLLNCDRPAPAVPAWARAAAASIPEPSLPAAPVAGDAGLISDLADDSEPSP